MNKVHRTQGNPVAIDLLSISEIRIKAASERRNVQQL